jgi:hypothetical protein
MHQKLIKLIDTNESWEMFPREKATKAEKWQEMDNDYYDFIDFIFSMTNKWIYAKECQTESL